ncbi:hypothetical protein KC354_g118 [Hortaea werneckii]|nr:hypothetical protein KC354_g118 [Hortaea werneckii]
MVVVAVVVVLEKVSDRDVEKAMRAPPPPRTLRCLVFAKWLPRRLLHSWWQRSDRWETTYYRLGVKPWAKKKRESHALAAEVINIHRRGTAFSVWLDTLALDVSLQSARDSSGKGVEVCDKQRMEGTYSKGLSRKERRWTTRARVRVVPKVRFGTVASPIRLHWTGQRAELHLRQRQKVQVDGSKMTCLIHNINIGESTNLPCLIRYLTFLGQCRCIVHGRHLYLNSKRTFFICCRWRHRPLSMRQSPSSGVAAWPSPPALGAHASALPFLLLVTAKSFEPSLLHDYLGILKSRADGLPKPTSHTRHLWPLESIVFDEAFLPRFYSVAQRRVLDVHLFASATVDSSSASSTVPLSEVLPCTNRAMHGLAGQYIHHADGNLEDFLTRELQLWTH